MSRRLKISHRLARVIVYAAVLAACGGSGEVSPPAPTIDGPPVSNLEMAARLRAIADRVDPAEYPYDNERRAELIYRQAQGLLPGPARFRALLQTALELIRAGAPEEGLERLGEALDLLRDSGAPLTRDTSISLLRLQTAAGLRLGEQENCLHHHTVESCLLPISAGGVHAVARGSRTAIDGLQKLLRLQPDSDGYRWLLNLAFMTLGEYPEGVSPEYLLPPEVFDSDHDLGRFVDVAGDAGVAVRALSGGAVMEDFDGDGRIDLVASSWGLRNPLRFFHHRESGGFEDKSDAAWLSGQLGGLNLTHADYDNDGDADLLVLRGGWLFDQGNHPNSLLQNQGSGTFVDVTEEAGLLTLVPSHTAAWGDFDNDGLLDLFVGNEPSGGQRHLSGLYRNLGDGSFSEVAVEVGLEVSGVVKAASWGDFDNDGLIDLYVSRFGEDNLLFHNRGPGAGGGWRFADVAGRSGVGEPRNSFPAWFFDYDNDGWLDIFVAGFGGFTGDSLADFVSHYFGPPFTGTTCRLFRNLGGGRSGAPRSGVPAFADVTAAAGLDRAVLAMGANFGDLDNDGWLDLYLGTGEPTMTTLVPNLMFRNDRGRGFQDVTTSGGFGNIQKGHGIAFGDLDGDGDQDLYVTMGGAYSGDVYPNLLFENPGHGNRWLTVRFVGSTSNRGAVGARVKVVVESAAGRRQIHRVVGTGGSFGSSTLQLEIGLGDADAVDMLEIYWPASGSRTRYEDVPLDAVVLAREDAVTLERLEVRPSRLRG